MARASLALVILTLVIAAIGAAYQALEQGHDAERFPQRGQSFRVGSIAINLNCSGEGLPTVILDSGLGGTSMDWMGVQPQIAKFTRVCSYDRAGYGWSDPSSAPRTSRQIAKELRQLLTSAKERGPYVLVGHSFGGYNIRMFNTLYPSDVAGMVLVDAEHPDEGSRLEEFRKKLPTPLRLRMKVIDKLRQLRDQFVEPIKLHLGLNRLMLTLGRTYDPSFPKDLQHEILFLEQQPKYVNAVDEENALDAESAAQVRSARDFNDRPLIVLTADEPYGGDPDDDLLTGDQRKIRDNIWINQLQSQYARLSKRGKQIVVGGSTHEMLIDRPDAIISAVREVWSAAR